MEASLRDDTFRFRLNQLQHWEGADDTCQSQKLNIMICKETVVILGNYLPTNVMLVGLEDHSGKVASASAELELLLIGPPGRG